MGAYCPYLNKKNMLFERRKQKPATAGSFCSIKKDFLLKMKESSYYINNSISLQAEKYDFNIYQSTLRTFKKEAILLEDIPFFVAKKSFVPGHLDLIPLMVNKDSLYGPAIKSLLDKKSLFTVSSKIMKTESVAHVKHSCGEVYSAGLVSYIGRVLESSQYYNTEIEW
tara:strand:+ start:1807 stop:2310 length:504 start_codon:yes stop_codon:yes gene_type:complete